MCVYGVMSLWKLLLFSMPLHIFTEALERVILNNKDALTCGQGIIDCEAKPVLGPCIGNDENVYVSSLNAYIVLCQTQENWSLCLKILVNVTVRDQSMDVELAGDASGDEVAEDINEEASTSVLQDDKENMTAAALRLCYTSPSLSDSRILRFTFPTSAFNGGNTMQVWMSLVVVIRDTDLGSPVLVYSSCTNSIKLSLDTFSKEKVCYMGLDVDFCKGGPRLHWKTDPVTGAIKLYMHDADKERFQTFEACQKREQDCMKVEWNDSQHEFEIPRSSVAPCLCFEIWGDFPRKGYCPFSNESVSKSSVSVSVSATEMSMESDLTALIWSLTAPCRLETELWLCRKGSWPGSSCQKISTKHHVHKFQNSTWFKTDLGQWQLQGEFSEIERYSSLCVQVKVMGMDGYLGPVCPFEVERSHWSFLLLVCVLLFCLSVLGAYAFQSALKSLVLRWLKVDNLNTGAAGSVEVLLVLPPNADHRVTELVCHLSSSLSTLGFNVSLDLWSRSEINALGPIPWLHSRLDQVQISGGRAVLVLTQNTCERANEWGCRGEGGNYEQKEDKDLCINADFQSSTCLDLFNASLSCILADYLQGHVGKRFMLVQFEGQLPGSHGQVTLPEFFHGLPLFSLPSQSLGLLMELTHGVHNVQVMAKWWIRPMSLKSAARTLSRGFSGLTGSTLHGSGTEDDLESVLLQQNQTPENQLYSHKNNKLGLN
ncbi:interleukin-17 receptor C isoform X2 [Paramisgurnus dabryanus]|uniref:interleukin-17 receptor C isoform X2 n=1 Tax=Paramisgurnus dabryanus TaxID=90735 RepID=UPI0031F37EE6